MLKRFKQPLIIAFIYLIIGSVWLLVSTLVLGSIEMDVPKLHTVMVWVRMSFIAFSALLFLILYTFFQKKLQEKITDYSTLFENNPNSMWVFDEETKVFLAVNKPAILKYGYSEVEFLSMTIFDIRAESEQERLSKHLDEFNRKKEGVWEHRKKNGELFYVEVSSQPIQWHGRNAMLIVSYDISIRNEYEKKLQDLNQQLERDVIERTQKLDILTRDLATSNEEYAATNEELIAANEELHTTNDHLNELQQKVREQADDLVRQSEEKLNKILASLEDVVWSAHFTGIDHMTKVNFMNEPATTNLFGYSVHDFFNDANLLQKSVYVEDIDIIQPVYQSLMTTNYSQIENRIQDKFGNIKWVSARVWLTRDSSGNPLRLDGIITNINDQKKAELDLLSQKDKLQKVFDNIPLMLVQFDASGAMVFANKCTEETLGWTFEEAKTRNMLLDLYPDEEIRNEVVEFMKSSKGGWGHFTMTTRHGTKIDSSWMNVRLADGSLIGIGQDITTLKEGEKEKTNLIEQLVEQNNDVLQFSFISSHNLRGPIATMLGLLQLVEKDKIDDPQLIHILDYMGKSVVKLEDVIRDLTKILEIRGIHSEPNELININESIANVQQMLMSQLATSQITFNINTSIVSHFFTVPSYLHSILYNLITNSIRYRDPERKLTISIDTFETDTTYGFVVEDNGLGIDLDRFHSKIFTLYQRFHTHIDGKGLGLYLIKTQLAILKGKIEVKSKPNTGSAFTVTLPKPKDNL